MTFAFYNYVTDTRRTIRFSNMASKVDEDTEEAKESVTELLQRKEEKNEGGVTEEEKNDKDIKEKGKSLENARIVEEVMDNFSGDESESDTFQDAVEDLNEKMDSCKTSSYAGANDGEVKTENEVVEEEEEEKLTPEEKEV